jgi:hypothetical protein
VGLPPWISGRRTFSLASLLAVLSGAPGAVASQSVVGWVIDPATDAGVEGVRVLLLNPALGTTAAEHWTDSAGRFLLSAPFAASYRLEGSRIGYGTVSSAPIWVGPADTVQVVLRMSMEPVDLPPIHVLVPGRTGDPRLGTMGYYQRQADYRNRSWAWFFSPEDLNEAQVFKVTDLLRDLRGVYLVRQGHRTFVQNRQGQRFTVFINGHRARLGRDESIDEHIAFGSVLAVEVYAQPYSPFGTAIVIWTGVREP